MRKSDPEVLFARAGRILTLREHARAELRVKLLRPVKDCEPPIADDVDAVLERLEALGLLDDIRYARLTAERCAVKGMSSAGILRELRARGIGREIAEAALPPEADDAGRLAELLQKPVFVRKLADERGRQSLCRALLRKGYSYAKIHAALQQEEDGIDGA
jgi:regulatory protein